MFDSKKDTEHSMGLLILRIAMGGMMLTHGYPKLLKLFSAPDKFADPIGLGPEFSLFLAVLAEVLCAILLIVGAGTRFVAVPLLITMLVAAFIVHGDDPFKKQEFALLYASGYLTLLLTGGGKISVDGMFKNYVDRFLGLSSDAR